MHVRVDVWLWVCLHVWGPGVGCLCVGGGVAEGVLQVVAAPEALAASQHKPVDGRVSATSVVQPFCWPLSSLAAAATIDVTAHNIDDRHAHQNRRTLAEHQNKRTKTGATSSSVLEECMRLSACCFRPPRHLRGGQLSNVPVRPALLVSGPGSSSSGRRGGPLSRAARDQALLEALREVCGFVSSAI